MAKSQQKAAATALSPKLTSTMSENGDVNLTDNTILGSRDSTSWGFSRNACTDVGANLMHLHHKCVDLHQAVYMSNLAEYSSSRSQNLTGVN